MLQPQETQALLARRMPSRPMTPWVPEAGASGYFAKASYRFLKKFASKRFPGSVMIDSG